MYPSLFLLPTSISPHATYRVKRRLDRITHFHVNNARESTPHIHGSLHLARLDYDVFHDEFLIVHGQFFTRQRCGYVTAVSHVSSDITVNAISCTLSQLRSGSTRAHVK